MAMLQAHAAITRSQDNQHGGALFMRRFSSQIRNSRNLSGCHVRECPFVRQRYDSEDTVDSHFRRHFSHLQKTPITNLP
jgi:hypothetical protein